MREEEFLQVIRDHPEDPTPQFVYADWLDEQGDLRGELIRTLLHFRDQPRRVCVFRLAEDTFGAASFWELFIKLSKTRQAGFLAINCEHLHSIKPRKFTRDQLRLLLWAAKAFRRFSAEGFGETELTALEESFVDGMRQAVSPHQERAVNDLHEMEIRIWEKTSAIQAETTSRRKVNRLRKSIDALDRKLRVLREKLNDANQLLACFETIQQYFRILRDGPYIMSYSSKSFLPQSVFFLDEERQFRTVIESHLGFHSK